MSALTQSLGSLMPRLLSPSATQRRVGGMDSVPFRAQLWPRPGLGGHTLAGTSTGDFGVQGRGQGLDGPRARISRQALPFHYLALENRSIKIMSFKNPAPAGQLQMVQMPGQVQTTAELASRPTWVRTSSWPTMCSSVLVSVWGMLVGSWG